MNLKNVVTRNFAIIALSSLFIFNNCSANLYESNQSIRKFPDFPEILIKKEIPPAKTYVEKRKRLLKEIVEVIMTYVGEEREKRIKYNEAYSPLEPLDDGIIDDKPFEPTYTEFSS